MWNGIKQGTDCISSLFPVFTRRFNDCIQKGKFLLRRTVQCLQPLADNGGVNICNTLCQFILRCNCFGVVYVYVDRRVFGDGNHLHKNVGICLVETDQDSNQFGCFVIVERNAAAQGQFLSRRLLVFYMKEAHIEHI